MKIYHYPKCSTCKKALQFLQSQGINHKAINIVENPPSKEELQRALASIGNLRKLFNTSGMRYKELGLKDILDQLSEEQAIEMLASDGMLIKRPLLLDKNIALAGFRENEWKESLTHIQSNS